MALRLRRTEHNAAKPEIAHDEAGSSELQTAMDAATYAGGAIPKTDAECVDNLYEETDPEELVNLASSNRATDYWYSGKQFYDFKQGTYTRKLQAYIEDAERSSNYTPEEIKAFDEQKEKANAFVRMVWKATTKVAFGIKGRYVYARYCKVGGEYAEPKKNIENIEEDCVKNEIDLCFERAALRAHNMKRAQHVGGRTLEAYPAASRHI